MIIIKIGLKVFHYKIRGKAFKLPKRKPVVTYKYF